MSEPVVEITAVAKTGGALTKRITLSADGTLLSDGSECVMVAGTAKRVTCTLQAFAAGISKCRNHEAITLGALRRELPDEVKVVTKRKLEELNGSANNIITRTGDYIFYRPEQPALALLDVDTKGMPGAVRDRIDEAGGFFAALASVIPALANTARVLRRSTSTGISNGDTGEELAGSNGAHIFPLVKDGGDIERFLRALHDRCWLGGFGWYMVGAAGQLLERSIIDRMVYAPERLVFEGSPVLDPPLLQDAASRRAVAHDGVALDTLAACPVLTIVEKAALRDLKAKDAHRLAPDQAKAREAFIAEQAEAISTRLKCPLDVARQTVERQCNGVLLPDVVLPFDDEDLEGCTAGDVLADPNRFAGATLADPLEGVAYGRGKAMIMRRASGAVWINSFAHGRTTYELKLGVPAIEAVLRNTPDEQLVDTFVQLMLSADMNTTEYQRLRDEVSKRTKINKRAIDQTIKQLLKERADKERQEKKNQRAAERTDPRIQILDPPADAPWLPTMSVLNEVLGKSAADEPPMRDDAGYVAEITLRPATSMHALTALGSNGEETDDTRLPAPEHPLLTRMDDVRLSEVIEKHIDFVDDNGRSVHLGAGFVRHFHRRSDGALPLVRAVATPMVLPNGDILSGHGLNREIGVVFRVPPQLQALVPDIKDCTPSAVANAMQFLTDEFLCDVACDYTGKCVLLSSVATILERLLFPERPAFFFDAGQRGSGKTTAANMVSYAALGVRAAAAAWSANDEERRKSFFSYASEAVPLIVWDNIMRGESISCITIEKALTAETCTDRILGVSEVRTVPCTMVHVLTGNNIAPRGDMASRSLRMRFEVDRPDPENRKFKHPDPIGWTEANRGRILQAIYTVLLGNPRLRPGSNLPPAETRFKAWWHLVGSAFEHAAQQHSERHQSEIRTMEAIFPPDRDERWHQRRATFETCPPKAVSFRDLFALGEAGEDQTASLGDVLSILREKYPAGFSGADVATWIAEFSTEAIEFRVALEAASGGKEIKAISAKTVTWRLKSMCGAPVNLSDGATAVLRFVPDHNAPSFVVKTLK